MFNVPKYEVCVKKLPKQYENDPQGLDDHIAMMEAQFENDKEAILEQTFATEINPIIGIIYFNFSFY